MRPHVHGPGCTCGVPTGAIRTDATESDERPKLAPPYYSVLVPGTTDTWARGSTLAEATAKAEAEAAKRTDARGKPKLALPKRVDGHAAAVYARFNEIDRKYDGRTTAEQAYTAKTLLDAGKITEALDYLDDVERELAAQSTSNERTDALPGENEAYEAMRARYANAWQRKL